MDLQATKLKLVKTILENENAEFLSKLSDFVKKEKQDFWHDLSEDEKAEIEQGIQELKSGKRVSFESILPKIS